MKILDNLFSPHLNNLQNSLGRTTQRHSLLTGNLANVNTPGYKRQDIAFNVMLQDETKRAETGLQRMRNQQAQRASEATSIRLDGNNVDVEKEVMAVAETELRYQALTDMTAGYFGSLKSVIREGK